MDPVRTTEMKVPPPVSLKKALGIPPRLLLGPGPSNCPQRILTASAQQMLGHLDEDFLQVMEETKAGIQYLFQTENKYTFAVSGTGHCAMETAVVNILQPGDVFLCVINGIWGERAMEIGHRIGVNCYSIRLPIGTALSLEELESEMQHVRPSALFVCHGESSTAFLQPLEGIGDICHKYNCLFLVDAVASAGGCPLFMDALGIDVLYTASQKVLNAPPGLSPISFSEKAILKIKGRRGNANTFYMDVLGLANYWNCDSDPIRYHHTAPINLVYALREALAILAEESLEKSWEKHKRCSELLCAGLEAAGFTLLVSQKDNRLPTVTAVKTSEDIVPARIILSIKKRFGIDIAGGLGPTSGVVLRVGLMGANCTEQNVKFLLEALEQTLTHFRTKSHL